MKKVISRIAVSSVFVVVVLCFTPTSTQAQQTNEVPKVEVGPFFTFLTDFGFDDHAFGGGETQVPDLRCCITGKLEVLAQREDSSHPERS
jgi:hypothetical protein